MQRTPRLSLILLLGLAATAIGQPPPGTGGRPVSTADSILAVYHRPGWVFPPKGPVLVFAAWGVGTAIWSGDRRAGGPPYRTGRVDPTRVATALARIEADGYFENEAFNLLHMGYDACSTVLLVKSGKKAVRMESWHELYERDGVVAGDKGLVHMPDRRLTALKREPADYLHYRLAWSELRGHFTSLIPTESRPIKGELYYDAGEVYWREGK
jgi:hypothetical protein